MYSHGVKQQSFTHSKYMEILIHIGVLQLL